LAGQVFQYYTGNLARKEGKRREERASDARAIVLGLRKKFRKNVTF
jgi:hypothetical protein